MASLMIMSPKQFNFHRPDDWPKWIRDLTDIMKHLNWLQNLKSAKLTL